MKARQGKPVLDWRSEKTEKWLRKTRVVEKKGGSYSPSPTGSVEVEMSFSSGSR